MAKVSDPQVFVPILVAIISGLFLIGPSFISKNSVPIIDDITVDPIGSQYVGNPVKMVVYARDLDKNDQIYYKFQLKGPSTHNEWKDKTAWSTDSSWTWKPTGLDVGENTIRIWTMDKKHAQSGDIKNDTKYIIKLEDDAKVDDSDTGSTDKESNLDILNEKESNAASDDDEKETTNIFIIQSSALSDNSPADYADDSDPSAVINQLYVEDNIWSGSSTGMVIHTKFNINNFAGKDGIVQAYFNFNNGAKIFDLDGYYSTSDGQVSVFGNFRPLYKYTLMDAPLFLPYSQLHLSPGIPTGIEISVIIWDNSEYPYTVLAQESIPFYYYGT